MALYQPRCASCKELQNLNAFFAIIMGLSNMAVARLTQTWERLPSKLKRTFSQFESQIDPSRNHRRYRIFMSKLEPPIIPFMPLFLKDMTFAHEGNKTYLENGLINFEKMVSGRRETIRVGDNKRVPYHGDPPMSPQPRFNEPFWAVTHGPADDVLASGYRPPVDGAQIIRLYKSTSSN